MLRKIIYAHYLLCCGQFSKAKGWSRVCLQKVCNVHSRQLVYPSYALHSDKPIWLDRLVATRNVLMWTLATDINWICFFRVKRVSLLLYSDWYCLNDNKIFQATLKMIWFSNRERCVTYFTLCKRTIYLLLCRWVMLSLPRPSPKFCRPNQRAFCERISPTSELWNRFGA